MGRLSNFSEEHFALGILLKHSKLSVLKKSLLIAAGSLAVALGFLGMFLPVLPTTPFLLLAAACYSRSSERFHFWLLHNRLLGRYISNYVEGRGMALRQKVVTIALIWVTIGSTIVFAVSHWALRLMLLATATGVSIHLARLKRAPQDPDSEIEAANRLSSLARSSIDSQS